MVHAHAEWPSRMVSNWIMQVAHIPWCVSVIASFVVFVVGRDPICKKPIFQTTKPSQAAESPQSCDSTALAPPVAMTDYAKLTVVQLKAECAKLKIDASGKKADLVER